MGIVKAGAFIGLLSETYVNAALPRFIDIFHQPAPTVQWIIAGYMLIMAIFVPVSAFLLHRLSTRSLFSAAMGIYLLGTLLCALSGNFPLLLTGRMIQAAGTSILLPLLMNSIILLYPPEQRGRAMGAAMLIVLIAPAVGPTYGGMIMEYLGWRWIFISSLPLALLILLLSGKYLSNISEKRDMKLDLPSLFLSVVGFGSLVFGLQRLFSVSLNPVIGPVSAVTGLCAIVILTIRQLKIPHPMLEVQVFTHSFFTKGVILYSLTQMIMFANFVLLPIYLVNVLGMTAFQAGLAVLPGGIIGATLPRLSGILYDRWGAGKIVLTGYVILTAANFFISRFSGTTSVWTAMGAYCLVMCGVAVILTPSQTHALNRLPRPKVAHGTAILNTLALIGASLGGAVFVGIMGIRQGQIAAGGKAGLPSLIGGLNFAYSMVTLVALAGVITSLFFLEGRGKKNTNQGKELL